MTDAQQPEIGTLKPCPFCGGEAELEDHRGGLFRIACTRKYCRATGPHAPDGLGVIQKWNTRTGDYAFCKLGRSERPRPHLTSSRSLSGRPVLQRG